MIIQAHDGVIYAMQARTAKSGLVSGGRDGAVKVWVNDSAAGVGKIAL